MRCKPLCMIASTDAVRYNHPLLRGGSKQWKTARALLAGMSLFTRIAIKVYADKNADRTSGQKTFGQIPLEENLRRALKQNDVDALSLLLSLDLNDVGARVEACSYELLQLAIGQDAAEGAFFHLCMQTDVKEAVPWPCIGALYLLDFLEEQRRAKQEEAEETERTAVKAEADAAEAAGEPPPKRLKPPAMSMELQRQLRKEYVVKRESFCGHAPTAPQLLVLARTALSCTPASPRCARVFLLCAHRLRKRHPAVGRPLLDTDEQP